MNKETNNHEVPSNNNSDKTARIGAVALNDSQNVHIKLGATAIARVLLDGGDEKKGIEQPILGYTKDGKAVIDRPDSHFHWESGMTQELFTEALGKIDTEERESFLEEVDFGREIGKNHCVEVGPEDEVVYAVRARRRGLTPLVKNREPISCSKMVVVLEKEAEKPNTYILKTAYIGEGTPREPWDSSIPSDKEFEEAKAFWSNHALIYDDKLIDHEKTAEYNAMTDAEKFNQQMSIMTYYSGLFVNRDELYQACSPKLEKTVDEPHITINFRPEAKQLHLDQVGSNAKITAIGYGNDGKNEGLLVKVESDDPKIQAAVDEVAVPHITLSYSEDSHPMYTSGLEFTPLEQPFEITGTYGIFTRKHDETGRSAVLSQDFLKKVEEEVRI